jgi:hypothetical protein
MASSERIVWLLIASQRRSTSRAKRIATIDRTMLTIALMSPNPEANRLDVGESETDLTMMDRPREAHHAIA